MKITNLTPDIPNPDIQPQLTTADELALANLYLSPF